METLVKVRDVHKVFQRGGERIDVLQGLDLDIPAGDFLALMGPSGSGQDDAAQPDRRARPADRRARSRSAGDRIDKLSGGKLAAWRARHVGFVFQLYNLLPVLTAARNVELPLLLTKLVEAERQQARATRAVGRRPRRPRATTIRASSPAARSSASASRAPSSPTRRCCSATSRPATSTARRATRSSTCCRRSTASTARRSSWSRTTRTPPSARERILHLDKGVLVAGGGDA